MSYRHPHNRMPPDFLPVWGAKPLDVSTHTKNRAGDEFLLRRIPLPMVSKKNRAPWPECSILILDFNATKNGQI